MIRLVGTKSGLLNILSLQRSFKLETFRDTAARMEKSLGRTNMDVER